MRRQYDGDLIFWLSIISGLIITICVVLVDGCRHKPVAVVPLNQVHYSMDCQVVETWRDAKTNNTGTVSHCTDKDGSTYVLTKTDAKPQP